jgi:hypothetical protein
VQAVLDTVVSLGVGEVAVVTNGLTSQLQLSILLEDLQTRNIRVGNSCTPLP